MEQTQRVCTHDMGQPSPWLYLALDLHHHWHHRTLQNTMTEELIQKIVGMAITLLCCAYIAKLLKDTEK